MDHVHGPFVTDYMDHRDKLHGASCHSWIIVTDYMEGGWAGYLLMLRRHM